MIFPAEYRLSRSDLGPFSDSMLGDYLRAVDFFEISFRIQQQFYNHSDVPESCYDWVIKLQFDYSYHSSVIATQVLTPYVCGGLDGMKQVGFTRHYLWIDVFVGVSALCSLLNLWKDFTTRMRLTSTLQSLGSWQALRLSEKLKFFSVPTLITMLGNYTQILSTAHSAALIALASTESSNETYHTLVGIGCFCALITVTSYYDHTSSSYLLINTLKRSAGDLLMYIFGLTPILLAFTGLGMCWFYPTGFFLTIVDTWATLLCLTLGDSVAFFFGLAMGVDLFFAQVYMYSFIVLFICGVQIIFLTYIRAAFHSFRRNPVSLLDDDSAYREQRLSSDGLVQLPAQISAIRKLERKYHSGMRSSRTFKHLISNGLQVMPVSPQDELEETTIELLREMDETAKQLTVLMIDLKDKAVENKEDELAVSRFRELVGSEIQGLCRETGTEGMDEDQFKVMGDVTRFGFYGMVMVMLFLGPLVHFKSGSLGSLWMLISFLLYTRWFGAMSIDSSPYFYSFMVNVSKSTNPRDIFSIGSGKKISQWRLGIYGVTDGRFLANSQQLLIALGVLAAVVAFCVVLGRGDASGCLQVLKKKVQYSLLILGWLFAYEDLLLYALLQLQEFEFDSVAGAVSSIVSVGYLVLAVAFVAFVPVILYRNRVKVQQGATEPCEKWIVLVESMRTDMSFLRYQLYPIYLFQRTIAAGLLTFLYSFGAVQIITMITLELLVLVWMLYARPFLSATENVLGIALQACVCILLMFQACFLKTWSDSEQVFLSLAYVGVYWAGIGACLLRFGIGLYGSRGEDEPQVETEVTKSEIKLTESVGKLTDNDEKIRSQLPNDYYDKMGGTRSGAKSNKVVPLTVTSESNARFGWMGQGRMA